MTKRKERIVMPHAEYPACCGEPKPTLRIVAECWTCPLSDFRIVLGDINIPVAHGHRKLATDSCRAAGHDVRPVKGE